MLHDVTALQREAETIPSAQWVRHSRLGEAVTRNAVVVAVVVVVVADDDGGRIGGDNDGLHDVVDAVDGVDGIEQCCCASWFPRSGSKTVP